MQAAMKLLGATIVVDFLGMYYLLEEQYAERSLAAGVNAVNVSFGGEAPWDATLKSIENGLLKIEHSSSLALVTDALTLRKAQQSGRLGIIIGTQGTSMLGEDLWRLGILHRLGLRTLGLNGSFANLYGSGSGELEDSGLTFLGRDLIDAANELRLLVDVSHCGHRTARDAIERARFPICSHANAYAVEATDRNRKDEEIAALAKKGGVIGLCALPRAVKKEAPSVEDLIRHLDHLTTVAGPQGVGLGLDLMEGYRESKTSSPGMLRRRTLRPDIFGTVDDYYRDDLPAGLSSISELPQFVQRLLDAGYREETLAAILGGNWVRVIDAATDPTAQGAPGETAERGRPEPRFPVAG